MATEVTTATKKRTAAPKATPAKKRTTAAGAEARKRSARKAVATRSTTMARENAKKAVGAARTAARANAQQGASVLQEYWDATVEAYSTAQAEVERQIEALMTSKRLTQSDAAKALQGVSNRLGKERKRALKEVDSRLRIVQARVKKERKALTGLMDDAVKGTLATLNIPSRQEVAELTRKVDELSRKIDSFRTKA